MKKELSKTGNLEKFRKYEMSNDELKKISGGRWVIIDGKLVWIEDK